MWIVDIIFWQGREGDVLTVLMTCVGSSIGHCWNVFWHNHVLFNLAFYFQTPWSLHILLQFWSCKLQQPMSLFYLLLIWDLIFDLIFQSNPQSKWVKWCNSSSCWRTLLLYARKTLMCYMRTNSSSSKIGLRGRWHLTGVEKKGFITTRHKPLV